MRLYTIVFITWAASIATSESNVANLNSDKVVDYTELSDLTAKQIVQPYVRGIEARSFRQTSSEDHPDDVANDKLNKSAFYADERRSNVIISTTEFSPSKVIYATPLIETAEKYPYTEHLNQEPDYAVPEDALLVENVGSFGQRVRHGQGHASDKTTVRTTNFGLADGQQNDRYADTRTSSSTTSSLGNEDNREESHASAARVSFASAQKKKNSLSGDSSSDESGATDSEVTSDKSGKTDTATSVEGNAAIESLPMSQARPSRTDNNATSDETTKKLAAEPESVRSVEISPSLQLGKFSGPIVVPDLPGKEPEEEAAVDYVNDAPDTLRDAEIIFETDEGSKIASNSITSSFMLNPLQVGITLVNANVAGLTDDSEQSAATDTKDYVQGFSRLASAGNNGSQSRVNYNENSRHFEEEKPAENKLSDNSVEIQKSVELYHVAPIHEIHYPVEYIQHTSNSVIETNNIGSSQKPEHSYNQDQQSNSQPTYDNYQDNNHERNVIKDAHASTFSQKLNRHEYAVSKGNVGKSTTPFLVAKYLPNINEQISFEAANLQPLRYNNVQPVLLVSPERSQFNDTIRDQSNVQYFNGNNINLSRHVKPAGIPVRLEATNKLVKTHTPSTYQEYQPVDHQHPFRSSETRRPEGSQLLLKIVPKGSSADGGFLVPLPRPYPVEKIVEKTIHVPHPIEIEKVIEKKIPFPVERVVEKQVQVPIQVPLPVPHPVQVVTRVAEKQIRAPYPINIEQIIDRRVPYAVHRFLIHPPPYPLHVKQPATYLTHVPSGDNPVEKSPAFSQSVRPYRANAEKTTDNDGLIIGTRVNKYQQKSRQPILNGETATPHLGSLRYEPYQNETNVSQYYSDLYSRSYDNNDITKNYVPAAHFSDVRLILPKKFDDHIVLRPPLSKPVFLRQQVVLNLMDRDKAIKDEYTNLETSRKLAHGKGFQTKSPQVPAQSSSPLITAVLRKSRQPDNIQYGSFRQSKMEYGFKPPMIPSVQYDESTATKVDS